MPRPAHSVHHFRRGSGEPLLLIHGLGGSSVVWRPVLDALAAERDVIAVDMPGFGRSPSLSPGVAPNAANLAGALGAFCEGLGVERPHVAGNSLGGWVGLEMARQGLARSVCALSPAGLWRVPLGPRRVERYRLGRIARPLIELLARSARGRAWLLRTTVARPERVPPADARAAIAAYLDSEGYLDTNAQMRGGVFEGAAEVSVPVTIAWGRGDRVVGSPRWERMPVQTRFLVLEGWGHTPTWDDPERVAALILEASGEAQAQPIRGRSP